MSGAALRAPEVPVRHELREITPRAREDAEAITRLHMALLGHGPMARLGALFLREFCYGTLLRERLLRAALYEVEGQPAGFVAWTGRSITFHRSAIRRHALRAAWLAARSVAREPGAARRLGKALWLMRSRRAERELARDPLGEVLSIGVLPEYRSPQFIQHTGLRLGEALVRHAMAALRRQRVAVMRMVVEAHNTPTLMLYHALGARFEPYQHAGEPMVHVWFDL
jgi:ribosomal protein S18 acetylase RimI-like enzyme